MRQHLARPASSAVFWDNLKFYWRLSAGIFVAVLLMASVVFFLIPKQYETGGEVLLPSQDANASLPNDHPDIMMSDTVARHAQQLLKTFLQTGSCEECSTALPQYKFQKLSDDFDVSHNYSAVMQSAVTAQVKPDSHVMHVRYHAEGHPSDLKTLLGLYLTAYQLESRSFIAHHVNTEQSRLGKQLKTAQHELEKAGEALKDYQLTHDVYDLNTQVSQRLIQRTLLDEQLKSLDADSAATENHIKQLQKQMAISPAVVQLVTRLNQDEIAVGLRQQIAMTEGEKAEWITQNGERTGGASGGASSGNQAGLGMLNEEINRLYGLLQNRLNELQKNSESFAKLGLSGFSSVPGVGNPEKLDARKLPGISGIDITLATQLVGQQLQQDAQKIRRTVLAAEAAKIEAALKPIPTQQLDYAQHNAQLELARTRVNTIQESMDTLSSFNDLNDQATLHFLKIPETPEQPVSPNALIYWPLALLLATGVAALFTQWLANADPVIRRPMQISSQFAGPLTGQAKCPVFAMNTLPNQREMRLQLDGQKSPLKSSLLGIQRTGKPGLPLSMQEVMVHLGNLQQKQQTRRVGLLPVSAFGTAQAGSLMLGLSMAEAGHKLMLVDTDFSPQAVSRFIQSFKIPLSRGIGEGPGLANYLEGQVEDFVDIIYPLGKSVCGSLIPSGRPTHANSFHMSPKNMAQLEADLSPHYEFIFFALASLRQSMDAVTIGRALDGVMLIVHPGITTNDELSHTLTTLRNAEVNLLGILYQPW